MALEQFITLPVAESTKLEVQHFDQSAAHWKITHVAPALAVLHDFIASPPPILSNSFPLQQAAALFEATGIRYFVVENTARVFQGVLCLRDLMNPHLMATMQQNHISFSELQVRDVMTPRNRIHAVSYASLRHARVGDVLHTMDALGDTYLCVTQSDVSSGADMRGLFSARDIARQVGIQKGPALRARTFSELKATLLEGWELDA